MGMLLQGGSICGQTVVLHPMPTSIGIEIVLNAGQDADKSAHCQIRYKETGSSLWMDAFPPDRINLNGVDQFRGSLFLLKPGTSYDIHAVIRDSTPVISATDLGIKTATTLTDRMAIPGTAIRWVAPGGSGNDYSETRPGNLKTLLGSGVACGTTIMVKEGIYSDINMSLSLSSSCTENSPITIMAAPGANPVFDGGHAGRLTWTRDAGDPHLFSANLPSGTDFTNLCMIGEKALYPYPTVSANILYGNYNLKDLNLGFDGFVRNNNQIWLKTSAGLHPDSNSITISKAFRWLTVYGNNRDAWLQIRGITIKNIAKSNVSGTSEYGAIACDIRGAGHILFDSCIFLYNNSHIAFSGQCDNLTIRNCRFVHQNGWWTHAMIKKSLVTSILNNTSQGRGCETGAIEISNIRYLQVINNVFSGVNSGVVSQFSTGLIEEADIIGNRFEDNFDAIECDGNWVNARILKNEIIRPMAGISMAPPMIGPRYIYRNIIRDMRGRRNEKDDPYFTGCSTPSTYRSAGIGIKTNPITEGNRGNIYIFNNTFHSADSLGYAFTSWDAEWRQIRFANNIFADSVKHPGYFHSLAQKPAFQWSSANDNYFSFSQASPLLVAKEIHGQYTCHDISSLAMLESVLRQISGSTAIRFAAPMSANPQFTAGFALSPGSPMIDAGNTIPGFYDFSGTAPDVGAIEFPNSNSIRTAEKPLVTIFPNPADHFIELRTEQIFGPWKIRLIKPNGHSVLEKEGTDSDQMLLHVSGLPDGYYIIQLICGDKLTAAGICIMHP